jgi:hypothetical protein
MPEITEIFRRHGEEYLARFGDAMPAWHRRAIAAVCGCRTPAMGGHLLGCDDCGHREYVYHSCRSRACSACHAEQSAAWVRARAGELLPVRYFHLVFTVPAALREPLRRSQDALCGALVRAAAEALTALAADPRYLGGTPAILAVLHTSGRTLTWHPHVHCLVPAGALDADGVWHEAPNPAFLVPVHALAKLFRGRFAALARTAAPEAELPADVFDAAQRWVVYAKPCFAGPAHVLDYLGRYVHRLPLGNGSIVSYGPDQVTFRCRDATTGAARTITLAPMEFLRRCLQHVPPPGFHRVRYYALWAAPRRRDLHRVQLLLCSVHPAAAAAVAAVTATPPPVRRPRVCPHCGSTRLAVILYFRPGARAPP